MFYLLTFVLICAIGIKGFFSYRELGELRRKVLMAESIAQREGTVTFRMGERSYPIPSWEELDNERGKYEPELQKFGVPANSSRFLPSIAGRNTFPGDYFDDPMIIQLCHDISKRDDAAVSKALNSGINVNTAGAGGTTPLLWAYANSNIHAFQGLLEHGANPDLATNDYVRVGHRHIYPGSTIPYDVALNGNGYQFFRAAMFETKDVNRRFHGGNNLLMASVRWRYPRDNTPMLLLPSILKSSIDLDAQNDIGETALHIAKLNPDACKMLLDAGANASIKNQDGKNFLDLIKSHSSKPYANLRAQITKTQDSTKTEQ